MNIDKDHLIPIYRAMTYERGDEKDTYTTIMNYGAAGIFWSFDSDGAITHNGYGSGKTFVLCALVKPEYINWVQTVYKSGYSLRDEKEIELIPNSDILIHRIYDDNEINLTLPKKFIIKT